MAIDLESIRARLKELNLFTSITDVESAAVAMETAARPPAAFVAVASERAAPNKMQGVHDQRVAVKIAVLFVVAAQIKSGKRPDIVEDTRLAIIGKLTAWTPLGGVAAFNYDAFDILRMGGGQIWAQCTFDTAWTIRK